jgi:ankyrin repeat protein
MADEIGTAQAFFELRAKDTDVVPENELQKTSADPLQLPPKRKRTKRAAPEGGYPPRPKTTKATVPNFKKKGYNLLMTAIAQGDIENAKLFIAAGDGLHDRSQRGWTPLMMACIEKNEELVQLLLDNGAASSIHVLSTSQMNAADYARLNGLNSVAQRLQQLENASKPGLRCQICSEVLRKKTKTQYIRETIRSGTEINELVKQFFALEVAPEFEKPE